MSLKNRSGKAIGPAVYEVGNVDGSSCDKATPAWVGFWEDGLRNAGYKPTDVRSCQIAGCPNTTENKGPTYIVGGHMYVKGKPKSMNYILPICKAHNGMKDLDCQNGVCMRYVRTKDTFIMPIVQAPCVQIEQDEVPLASMARLSTSDVKEISGTRARDALLNEPGAYIMCAKRNCSRCTIAKKSYVQHAARDKNPHYFVLEENDRDRFFDQLDPTFDANGGMFPIIIKVTAPRKYDDNTAAFI